MFKFWRTKTEPGEKLKKDQEKLRKEAEREGKILVDRSLMKQKTKISTLLLEMIQPLLADVTNEEEAQGVVSLSIVAWNAGIIKAVSGEKELDKALKEFKRKANREEQKILNEYIAIKCNKYGQYKEIITNFKMSVEKIGHLNLTVVSGNIT